MRSIDYMIEVMQAWKDGKDVQIKTVDGKWVTYDRDEDEYPKWNWKDFDYRIKRDKPDLVDIYGQAGIGGSRHGGAIRAVFDAGVKWGRENPAEV